MGWTYTFECSILEIYVSSIFDLLAKNRTALDIRQNARKEVGYAIVYLYRVSL